MALAQLLGAAALFALGGLFMKLSDGAARPGATVAFLALFAAGAVLQAFAMKQNDLGASYIFVLGAEAVITLVISAFYLQEPYTMSRLAAISLVVVGIGWLRTT